MPPNIDWTILDRYLAGEASDAERALAERWLAASPILRELVRGLYRSDLTEENVRSAQEDVRAGLERVLAADHQAVAPSPVARQVATAIKRRGVPTLRAAAIAALFLGGALSILHVAGTTDPVQINLPHTLVAPPGQRVSATLPDGSKVILSPGSTIEYPSLLRQGARDIVLRGEAYFDVRHDRARPFVVRAGNLVIEDLGTQFVVRAYPEDAYGRVVVRKGLVGIGDMVVSPGEMGWIEPNGTPRVAPVAAAGWFDWTQGRLVFDGVSLREALPKLTRWYGIDIRLAEPALGDRLVVATLPEQSVANALAAIALALDLEVTREGAVVTLAARAPSPTPSTEPPRR